LAEQYMRAFVSADFMSVVYEQGADSMEDGIVEPVGHSVP
jgi:hypothetical protein